MSEQEKKARFTPEQTAAIEAEGKTIVSASAGSGKTTVMIEKIIRLIQSGVDVSEILAVTFTNKAAAQMKEKLRKAIMKSINEPSVTSARRSALKKQLDGVSSADISTIHSFCGKLIRSHFYAAGVDNSFRIINSDDAEGKALKNGALDELLDEGYEQKDAAFMQLLLTYWRKKSDNNLRGILLSAYEELRTRADYRSYLENARYDEDTFEKVCGELLETLHKKCNYYLNFALEEREYFQEIEGKPQLALCDELIGGLENIISAKTYFEACELKKPSFTSKRTSKNDSEEKRRHIERLAAIKEKIVKIYDGELSKTQTREVELSNFLRAGETAVALGEYLLRFDDKYSLLKNERNVLDYNDLEHKALKLLEDEEIVNDVRGKYRYVFVDEYQDVNPVQEAIISKLAGENLFLVGDVKQSIYGFRGSQSKFFVEKRKEFETSGGNSLMMTSNFRSSDAVLDAVNAQFELAMTPTTSNVDYKHDSWMNRGGRYALNDGRTQIHYLPELPKADKKQRGVYSVRANTKKKQEEEQAAAKLIRAIIEEERMRKWYDADTGEYKRVEYRDIAVLSRKKQGQIEKTVAALAAQGIPVTTATAVNICDYAEIKTLMDILSLIDNAEQDVPLASALLSPMGNLTADELASIRLEYKQEKFFRKACKRYAEEQKDLTAYKLRKFYDYFQQLCLLSNLLNAGELLTKLISDTRMEGVLLSKENGGACLKRIHRFIEETYNPEPLCVHEFLQRLRDLGYKIEFSENGGENSVKVLTMHSSKGLEYPIVILDDLNANFKGVDHDEVLLEERYGLAPRAFCEKNMTKSTTLLRRLCEVRGMENSIADELNLYYVALTRAKYGLHLLFKKPNVFADVRYATSFAEFTDFSVWERYVVRDELFDLPKQERLALPFHPNEELAKEIMTAFLWQYPYKGGENLPVKSSATQLLQKDTPVFAFEESENDELEENTDKTSIEAGTACHAFLETFDFSLLFTPNGERISFEELSKLVDEAYDKAMQENTIDNLSLLTKKKLTEVLSNDVFYQLQDCRLYKEQQFLVSLPIKDTFAQADETLTDSNEEMIFQGAIDLLAVSEEEIRVIDYKYSVKNAEQLLEHYRPQLELYRLAVAKILNQPKEKIRLSIVNIYRGFQVDVE